MGEQAFVIRGARVVDPAQGLDKQTDVCVIGEEISDVGTGLDIPEGAREIDGCGLVVTAGLMDIHVHLREPGGETSETIGSGCEAAARGGFTCVWCMPNTDPVCDSAMGVRYVLDRAREGCGVRVVPIASVTRGMRGEKLSEFGALVVAGAGAFSDDGRPVESAEMMRRAMQHIGDLGGVIFDHCEDLSITGDGVVHEGEAAMRLGLAGIPRSSESTIAARDGLLALETGCRLHVCHVSNWETVEVVRALKGMGAPVTAEVSPHHLTLTDEAVERLGTRAKMKPPLCGGVDREALIAGVEDGTIDCIATDHAPHARELKARGMDAAPFGIIGLETAMAVVHRAFVETGRWSLGFVVEKMSSAPARVVGWECATVRAGARADLAVWEIGGVYTLGEEHLGSKSRNSPWLGEVFGARCVGTICGGRVAYADGAVAGAY